MAMRGAIPNTKLKPSSPSQNGAAGNNHRQLRKSDYKEIRNEPAPDNQACLLESPYFGDTVIDDI
mgnify:CR=1 FL=1